MKFTKLKIIAAILIMCSSCNNQLDIPVSFEVTATSNNSTMSGDTLIVQKSTPVIFNFVGNPDFITFYSGELGHELSKKEQNTFLSPDVQSSYLIFSNLPTSGLIPGTLKVFLSTSFSDLLFNNKSKDSMNIVSHNWIDLTDSCNLSTTSGVSKTTTISLKTYIDKKITVAFLYKTDQNSTIQPAWEIGNLRVVNTLISGEIITLQAANIGFNPIDLLSQTTPYASTTGAGIWDVSNVASATTPKIKIGASATGLPLNDDWLISNSGYINVRVPDTGVCIKSISNTLNTYEHTFETSGVYTVGFEAKMQNYKYNSANCKSLIIKVI